MINYMYFNLKISTQLLNSSLLILYNLSYRKLVSIPGEVLWEFLGGDVPLGP